MGATCCNRSRVPASLVHRALQPLVRVAASGVPVLLVPGNHERSAIPYPLLAAQERLHVLDRPSTVVVECRGVRVAFAGFPYARDVRRRFPALLDATGYRASSVDARVLCVHHCIEGATCGPPPGYTFRDGDDVIAASDLPGDVALVLSGHVHRQQVLRRDLRGRLLPAPVIYAGSVERTSFAEREEAKGFVLATIAAGGGGRLDGYTCSTRPTARSAVLCAAVKVAAWRSSRGGGEQPSMSAPLERAMRERIVLARDEALDAPRGMHAAPVSWRRSRAARLSVRRAQRPRVRGARRACEGDGGGPLARSPG